MAMDTVTISGEHRRTPCVVKFQPSGHPKMKWLATATINGQEFDPVLIAVPPRCADQGTARTHQHVGPAKAADSAHWHLTSPPGQRGDEAMAKKLRVDVVKRELELLAAGAQGGSVTLEYDEWPTITQCLDTESLQRFMCSVRNRWFQPEDTKEPETFLFEIGSLIHWKTFDTLADEIVQERKRIDSLIKRDAEAAQTTK